MWFWNKTTGLNADVERHRTEESELNDKITKLEALENPTDMEKQCLAVYRNFLSLLLKSKADVVNKIGRKQK